MYASTIALSLCRKLRNCPIASALRGLAPGRGERNWRGNAVGCVLGVLFLISSRSVLARAPEHGTIVAVVDDNWEVILPRLRAELASAGFRLLVVRSPQFHLDRQQLEDLAHEEGAMGGLSLVSSQLGPELWVVDRTTGHMIFRDDLMGFGEGARADAVAVRVVEALRATLLQVEHPLPDFKEPAVAPPTLLAAASPPIVRPRRFAVRIAGGPGYSAGGLGLTNHLLGSFLWQATPRFRLALDAGMTPIPASVGGPEGRARVGLYTAGISFAYCLVDPSRIVRLRSGAGTWLGVMTMDGTAATGYQSQHAVVVAALPHIDLAADLLLTKRVGLGLSLLGGGSAPGIAVVFAGRQVTTWGRPFLLSVLTLDAWFD